MIEETLTRLLRGVTARVHPLLAPASATAPFVTYGRVSTPRLRDMDGLLGIASPTFRVDVYAASFLAARQLADAARHALDGYADDDVLDIALVQERDLSDLTSSTALYRVNLEFRIVHRESTGA